MWTVKKLLLSLFEITAFRLESKSCKGFFFEKINFPPTRALEFITGHMIYNLAYTLILQTTTTRYHLSKIKKSKKEKNVIWAKCKKGHFWHHIASLQSWWGFMSAAFPLTDCITSTIEYEFPTLHCATHPLRGRSQTTLLLTPYSPPTEICDKIPLLH